MASTEQQKAFIARIAPLAQENWRKYRILPSLTLAQACCESAYGTSTTMSRYHAYFGIKATSSFMSAGGKCFSMKTKEEYTVGTMTTIVDKFRAYDSDAEGVADHGKFLSGLTRYRNLVGNTSFADCAQKIREDGYATASAYTVALQKVYTLHNLGQYDALALQPGAFEATVGTVSAAQPAPAAAQPAAQAVSVSDFGSTTLRTGSRSDAVKALQNALNALGFDCGTADGIFGAKTQTAVKNYQAKNGLVADGLVGAKTKVALAAALAAKG